MEREKVFSLFINQPNKSLTSRCSLVYTIQCTNAWYLIVSATSVNVRDWRYIMYIKILVRRGRVVTVDRYPQTPPPPPPPPPPLPRPGCCHWDPSAAI